MPYITENTMEKRIARMDAALSLKEGDRVPIAPKLGTPYAQAAGISMYEALVDFRNMKSGVENFLNRYETDLYWSPAAYPINVMEVLGTTAVRWPGATWGIDRHKGFQVCDATYMEDDEYDEFIKNPAHFLMTKVWPRRHTKLKGLAKLSFNNVVEFGHYASMAAFADPEVRETLHTLMAAGEQAQKWNEAQAMLNETALAMQTPLGCIIGQSAPYDMFADNIRGYLNVPMDIYEEPEKVKAAIDIMTDFALENVENIHKMGLKYCFMPLHGGTDDFMSDETYREFYLPGLKKLIDREIELGLTPYIFFEGKYQKRLELLRDELPKGKILGMFEQVDIASAKKILGDHMCICGNLPGALLAYGTPEKIIDETKRMIDICAPGGGFVMDCSIVMDHYREENMDAWFQTTMDYGKY